MIKILIPGYRGLHLSYLVLDFNGTLASDGKMLKGVAEKLNELAEKLEIHIVTADTFGKAKQQLKDVKCKVVVADEAEQQSQKLGYIAELGAESVVAIGNGRNDALMLKHAALGLAVVQKEGACSETIMAADIVNTDILDALDLLTNPKRIIATLRK